MNKAQKYCKLVEEDKRATEIVRRGKTFEEFTKKTDNKQFQNQVKRSADQKIVQGHRRLEDRRNKLRKLLTEDGIKFSMECEQTSQFITKSKSEDMEREALRLKQNRLQDEENFVGEKIIQKIKDGSEEVRTLVSRQNVLDAKRAQLKQIEEKELKKNTEKQIETMWNEHAADIKKCERKNMDGVKMNLKQAEETTRKQLLHQIQLKKQILEQEHWVKQLEKEENEKALEEIETERKRAHEEKLKKMIEQKEMYQKLLKKKQEMEESRRHELLELERLQRKEIEKEIQRELEEKFKYKMQKKLEADLFLKYLENVRMERENLNRLFDESKKQEALQLMQRQEDERKRFEEARKKLNRKVLDVRERQILERRELESLEREIRLREKEMTEVGRLKIKEAENEENQRHRERAHKYFVDITSQVEEKKHLEEQKKLMDIQEHEKEMKKQEAMRKTIQDLIAEPTKI